MNQGRGLWGSADDWQALQLRTWETEIVSRFLSWHGAHAECASLRRWQREHTGQNGMTWEGVHALFPSYPAYFRARLFTGLAKRTTISRLYTRFSDLPCVAAYGEMLEDLPATAPELAVLVFPWPHLQTRLGNAMALHAWRREPAWCGVWFTFRSREGDALVLQPLQQLVETLDVPLRSSD